MDKNTFTGLLLIIAILIGSFILNAPSEEEIAEQKRMRDSVAQVEAQKERIDEEREQINETQAAEDETNTALIANTNATSDSSSVDSVQDIQAEQLYGSFAAATKGEEQFYLLESDVLKLTFSNKGGRLISASLKDYETYEGMPLELFDSTSRFNLNFFTRDNKNIYTDELYFRSDNQNTRITGSDEVKMVFRLPAANDRYLEYIYTIKGDSYLIDFDVNLVKMDEVLDMRSGEIYLDWMVNAPNQEKSLKNQRDATTVFYKYKGEDVDDLGIGAEEKEEFEASLKWVSLKQQFFNTTLIADEFFEKSKSFAEVTTDEGSLDYVKTLKTSLTLPVNGNSLETFGMSLYLGPNKYNILKQHGDDLQDIINLGWGIFGWVNQFAVIPVFNFLDSFSLSYGIIILILTILLKVVLSPITYKTYLSGAKMRVLKPEIDDINKKYKDDAMKKQQAMMTLYRQTGVNPLSGCVPLLIQMPILFAMFRFFPASIELRQEGFLWADDLSTYDSIYNFPDGFSIPFYGDHISLFTLLMAVSIMLYTKFNSQMTMSAAAEGPLAAQMKIMTYLMPVMMLFFFNSYSSGLSYYYFLANIISIGQTFLIRKLFINEGAIRAKIEENKKKPKGKKKSGFQKRLEEMAKQKGVASKK
ncbi:MAG: membrane protein insertase YidC [Verrucomicrobia bacterium]|nr:membrane protein insertase YidC [Verrucomicrobiota bacterium]